MYMNAQIAVTTAEPSRTEPAEEALAALFTGRSLSQDESETLFAELVAGRLSEPSIAALLIALKIKGETADELIGAARALRAADAPFERPDYLFADSCGTGGDGSGTINLSTAVAFVAAAAGLPVAKHGNRSVTSRCGSADVLERLGVNLDASAEVSRRALDEIGLCFLFAPNLPSRPQACRAGAARAQGPHGDERARSLREPGGAAGPAARRRRSAPARAGGAGPRRHRASSGRWSSTAPASTRSRSMARPRPCASSDGRFEPIVFTPEQAGLERAPLTALQGGEPEENAERLKALLMGHGTAAERRAVAINAGALLLTAGKAATLKEGADLALQALGSGRRLSHPQGLRRDQQWLIRKAYLARSRGESAPTSPRGSAA